MIEVFEGAEIRQALLSYLVRRKISVKFIDQLVVYDIWGHEIDHGAPAREFKELKIRFKS